MGNWFGRTKLMVKPLENDVERKKSGEEDERRRRFDAASRPMRIKVRMSKRQLEGLKAQAADSSKGNWELGRLIVKECLEGKLSPGVVVAGQGGHAWENSGLRLLSLSTIDEEAIANESL